MRITEKGQVTIPVQLREEMGFLPHTEIEFVRRGNELVVKKNQSARRKKSKTRGQMLVEHLRSFSSQIEMTGDEVMRLTRGE